MTRFPKKRLRREKKSLEYRSLSYRAIKSILTNARGDREEKNLTRDSPSFTPHRLSLEKLRENSEGSGRSKRLRSNW